MTGGVFSVALSVAFPRPGVTWRLALWSPDFPHPFQPKLECSCIAPTSDWKVLGKGGNSNWSICCDGWM